MLRIVLEAANLKIYSKYIHQKHTLILRNTFWYISWFLDSKKNLLILYISLEYNFLDYY